MQFSTRFGFWVASRGALCAIAVGTLACAGGAGSSNGLSEDRRARAHYNVAIDHLREGRAAMAIRELQSAERMDPQDPWIQVSLAEGLRRKGLHEKAEVHLLKALRLAPDMQPAKLNLSALYIELERYQEAIVPAQELLDDPTFPVPWKALANMGWAQYRLGQHAEARRSLETALEYYPDYWPVVLSLAALDGEQGRRLEAIAGLERVLEIDPGPLPRAEANYRLAELYIALGNRAKAVQHLTASSATRPSGVWGKRSEDYLRRLR